MYLSRLGAISPWLGLGCAFMGLGCGAEGPAEQSGGVESADIERAVRAGPEAAAELIASQPTPESRIATMNDAIQVAENQATAICPHLSEVGLESECDKRASRHHLWVAPEQTQGTVEAGGIGPASSELIHADDTVSRYADVTPSPGSCAPGDSTCLNPAALEAARSGDADEIAGLCAGLTHQRSREECFFASAELMVGQDWDRRYAGASELCLNAGSYSARCLAHLVNARTIDVSRHGPENVDWDDYRASAQVIADTWEDRDPDLFLATTGRFWAGAIKAAVDGAESLDGSLINELPEHTVHIRAAVAWRLVVGAQGKGRDLQGWTNAVLGMLTAAPTETGATYESPPSDTLSTTHLVDLWPASVPVGDGMVVVNYGGTSRRLVASEPVIDSMICVLEAAARVNGSGGVALLKEGIRHQDARIRWTVDRLWSARYTRDNPNIRASGSAAGPSRPTTAAGKPSGNAAPIGAGKAGKAPVGAVQAGGVGKASKAGSVPAGGKRR